MICEQIAGWTTATGILPVFMLCTIEMPSVQVFSTQVSWVISGWNLIMGDSGEVGLSDSNRRMENVVALILAADFIERTQFVSCLDLHWGPV